MTDAELDAVIGSSRGYCAIMRGHPDIKDQEMRLIGTGDTFMLSEAIDGMLDHMEKTASAIIELRADLSKAKELLACINAAMKAADETCEEPGISFLEAARREMADRKRMVGM